MKKIGVGSVLSLVVVFSLFSGANAERVSMVQEYPLEIVATTGMVGDIVTQVVGRNGSVHVLMGEEVDPHLYRPTRADIARMQRADVIFYNGLHLEGRMADALVQLARTRPVYAVTERVDESILKPHEEYEASFDPHLWMDVRLWMKAVDVVLSALVEYDPAGSAIYQRNALVYQAELEELDTYVRKIMATIPHERRFLITAHDAFGYFGEAYDIEVIGVQGISTESEAGLEDINRLVSFIVDNRIAAVFAETTVPDRAMTAVIEGASARGHRVEIGGELFSDAMGPQGSYEGTYRGMIDHNATTIVRALGGTAAEGGLSGSLSARASGNTEP